MNDAFFSVEGQVVLVSEASRGMGKAIARAFCGAGRSGSNHRSWFPFFGGDSGGNEEAGGFCGRGSCGKNSGGNGAAEAVFPIRCDVAVKVDVEALVDLVVFRFGRMDTLVNVAGVNRRKPAEVITEEDYNWVLDVNLKGAFRLSQKAGQRMIARGCGC